MNSSKIKKLIKKYESKYDHMSHNDHIIETTKNKIKKTNLEDENDRLDADLYNIYEEIKNCNPSKYMINKYPELEDILNFF